MRLLVRERAGTFTAPRAVLRTVDGTDVSLDDGPATTTRDGEIETSWVVPARRLPRGDYPLFVSAEVAPGTRETVTTRFFRVRN